MKRLIKRILREEIEKSDKHYRILDKISEYVQLPYFKSMVGLTIDDKDDQLYIMKKIYGNDIYIRGDVIRDDKGKIIYFKRSNGYWEKQEYDDKGNKIYYERSTGYWEKWGYDDDGNQIYYENSVGFWQKNEYDDNGNRIYQERSDGFWWKWEYGDNGDMLYYENSNGNIWDNR